MICIGTLNNDGTVTLSTEEAGWLRELFSRLAPMESVVRTSTRDLERGGQGLVEHMKRRTTDEMATLAEPEAVTHRMVRCPPSSEGEARLAHRFDLNEMTGVDAALASHMVVLRKGLPPTPYGMMQRERATAPYRKMPAAEAIRAMAKPAFVLNPHVLTPEGYK